MAGLNKEKLNTSALNFREYRGIMTPSSTMGSHGRVPGGPLSRNEKTRTNRTSHIAQRYGNSATQGQGFNNLNSVFVDT
jgi:hypothetical protein